VVGGANIGNSYHKDFRFLSYGAQEYLCNGKLKKFPKASIKWIFGPKKRFYIEKWGIY